MILKIGNKDFSDIVAGLKVNYETLVSDDSGRNANGDTVIDIVNRKIKLNINIRYTTEDEMQAFLKAVDPYVVQVSFQDPKTKLAKSITAYTSTPSPEYYTASGNTIYKPLSINLIEL